MEKDNRREHYDSSRNSSNGGLYKDVKVPVSWLNIAILGGLAALVLLIVFGSAKSGYTVRYNSRGGSDVSEQTYQYQQPLELPENPVRQGYTFNGWALYENGSEMAEPGMPVENSMELYALWKPDE